MKVLIIDNTRPDGTVSGWRVNTQQELEAANPGDEHFVLASSAAAARAFNPVPAGWLVTWHQGSDIPTGIRGRKFSHSGIDPVFSSGLNTLLNARPGLPVANALDRLIFCLLDVESAFLRASIRALSTLYDDSISKELLGNLPQIKNDDNPRASTVCTDLCAVFDVLENGSEVKKKIEAQCKEFRDSLCEANLFEQMRNFRDFLLGGDDDHDGIVQEIKSLASREARPS